jgi:hypothetical protein
MKLIPLSNRDFGMMVSDEDYDFISQFTWRAKSSRSGDYAVTSIRISRVPDRVATIRAHRLIAGCWDDHVVDHLDFNHFNNQRWNLRITTNIENAARNNPNDVALYGDNIEEYVKHMNEIPF